ncbi:DUF1178 family protein [Hyphomicrobium sp.]|uniref:DUF1178 family protein n=1 Tax=Hyphomicrobium sp. TaxID=82 RepID=UPI000FBD723A|nr:DUF1178 family protein [Hyphomicrobium sp.]RUP08513.1 MAG: DUF1178 family protein [Hyphomicrobium sp.]
MIKYRLGCPSGHEFESWFRASADYDAQALAGEIACPLCGSIDISKQPMAPSIVTNSSAAARPAKVPSTQAGDAKAALEALRAIKKSIFENSEDVGVRFAEEARKMHFGEIEERHIRGSSTLEEAQELVQEGVPFGILPALPEDLN